MTVKIFEFSAVLRGIDVFQKSVQFISHVNTIVGKFCVWGKIIINIIGYCQIKEIIHGDAVQFGEIVQGIERRVDSPCLIMGIGLSGDVQMRSYEFLGIIAGFSQLF